MTIEEIIRANRPKITDGTIKTYKSIIVNFGKQMGIKIETPEDVIANATAIVNHLKNVSSNVRKTRLSAMITFVEGAPNAKDTLELFNKSMKIAMKEVDVEADKQEMNEKQKKAMIPWSDIMKKYYELEGQVEPLMEKDDLSKEEFQIFQTYVLLSCMVLIEPRRSMDWTEFKLRNIDESSDNFLKMIKRKPYLVFNKFKTVKTEGQQIIPCPPRLHKILKGEWFFKNKHDWLLMNVSQKNKINSTQFKKLLYDFFGSNISTNILRHIYLTNKYEALPALKDMKKTASNMGHSVGTALQYVKK